MTGVEEYGVGIAIDDVVVVLAVEYELGVVNDEEYEEDGVDA